MKDLIDKIQKCLLFVSLSEDQLLRFFGVFPPQVREYQKDEVIIRRNEHFHKVGCVLKGRAAVHQDTSYGSSHIITWINESDTFAEVLMFVPDQPYPTSISADGPMQVLFIEPDQITRDIGHIRDVQHLLLINITRLIAQKAFLLHKKVDILTIKSIQGKICHYLIQQSERYGLNRFSINLNREQMAGYLHVSRPSLSRELRKLQLDQIIDYTGRTFEIINRSQCERIANED